LVHHPATTRTIPCVNGCCTVACLLKRRK
jgi:hypothetical protein